MIKEYKWAYAEAGENRAKITESLSAVLHELVRTLLFVPVKYDQQYESKGDTGIHFSMRAGQKFNIDSIIYRAEKMSYEQLLTNRWLIDNGIPTIDMDW